MASGSVWALCKPGEEKEVLERLHKELIQKEVHLDEEILAPETRSSILPMLYPSIHECLSKQQACFWRTHEFEGMLPEDIQDWKKLSKDEQHFIKMVLAFFAASDLIVNKNISERFKKDIQKHEIVELYNWQESMEFIHSRAYAILIDTYFTDAVEKQFLFDAKNTIPMVKKKAEWAERWIASEHSYQERLFAFACVEGIFFSGAFCSIFWLREKKVMPALCASNDFISRDEGLHVSAAVEIYKLFRHRVDEKIIHDIVLNAVSVELEFITVSLPCRLLGMNCDMMSKYIRYCANRLLKQFGYEPCFDNAEQPFTFMDSIAMDTKPNFFERKANEYQLSESTTKDEDPFKCFDIKK